MIHNKLVGAPFVILNDKGYYELFDKKGNKIDLLLLKMRITMTAYDPSQILLTGVVNVMKDQEQMMKFIEENNPIPPTPPKDTVVKNEIRRPVQ